METEEYKWKTTGNFCKLWPIQALTSYILSVGLEILTTRAMKGIYYPLEYNIR
jgi:hypothetical protein